jgi:hypothetical protein
VTLFNKIQHNATTKWIFTVFLDNYSLVVMVWQFDFASWIKVGFSVS